MENETLNLENTTSEGESTEVAEDNGSATTPTEQTTEATTEVEGETLTDNGEGTGTPAPFLTIRYNHEDKPITQDEAITLAQKGMAYDSIYKSVQRAAALKGMDVRTFISSFEKAQDDAYRESLVEKYGEDDTETIESLMELYQSKKESTVKAAEEAEAQKQREQQTTLESRLADEFIELQKEFPEIEKFEALPKSVVSAAAKGQNLLTAYLLHQHTENKKVEAAKKTAETAKKASGGSMSSSEAQQTSIDAFMRGLYG